MSYADHKHVAGTYDAAAAGYSTAWQDEEQIPHVRLENELVRRMLGDCNGMLVMDIAGGSGGHARKAIEAGASHVDVVDLSSGMMEVGKQIEAKAGRDSIGWHLADAFKPFADQLSGLPQGGYDIVMAIWPFDHAANDSELDGIYRNISVYLKPGGRLVAVRMANPYAQSAKVGKYGSRFNDIQPIADGVKLTYTIFTNPPFTLDASSMEASYSGSTAVAEKFGIQNVEVLDISQTDTVKADPLFWQEMVEDPHFVGFTGLKAL